MTNEFEMRAQIETFLFREAACLDAWQLDEWLQMFTSDCAYEIAPIGIDDPEAASPKTELFVVCDDRVRLEHRVKRLKDPKAHAEFPHSRTRHQYTNVLVTADDGAELTARLNFTTYKTRKRQTVSYIGSTRYHLVRNADTIQIRNKRVMLDLDYLLPQGNVAVIL